MGKRSPDAPAFLVFSLAIGVSGVVLLTLSTLRATAVPPSSLLVMAAIALTMRLNTFTIPPRIVVSLVSTVQLASVILFGAAMAAWISVGTFLLALLARRPSGVAPRVFLSVVSFNVGMEALMTLAAGAAWSAAGGVPSPPPVFLLTLPGLLAVLALASALKVVNETLMTAGSYLRGIPVGDYLAGARRVLIAEAGMLPLGVLLALVGATSGSRGLALAALVLGLTSVIVKRLSNTRDELERINLDLERRVGELDVVGRVGRTISSAIEIEEVLETTHRHCSELVNTGNFFIALAHPEDGELEIALHTEAGRRLPQRRIRVGEGLTSLVLQRREPVLIQDLEKEGEHLPVKPLQVAPLRTRSWLGVPLIAGDEVLGVMTVQDERPDAYDDHTVRVLTTIAAQVAITVKNAQLVRATVDRARLEEENRSLRTLSQRKNEFVNMVAHQLQAPLTAIIGFTDLVRRNHTAPSAAENLELIHRESRRLSTLVEQLLSLARIRSGRITPNLRRVDLNAIAKEVVDAHHPLLLERDITIEADLARGGLLVDADPALLHEALANLVSNAVKYSPAGARVCLSTVAEPDANGGLAVLVVKDRGPGIPPQHRERIFDEFYRSPGPETQRVKGSGLGLTIAREIAEIHGGRISVESAEGGGSTFRIVLSAPAADRSF